MTARRSDLITAAAGMSAVVLLVAELLTWTNPQFTDPLSRITNYFVTNRSMALASLELGLMGAVALLIFGAGLRAVLRREEDEHADVLSTVVFGSAILFVSTEITFVMTTGAFAFVTGQGSESQIRLLLALENWIDQFRFLPVGILIGSASLTMIGGHAFPRWIRWLGLAGGALLLVSEVANLDPLGPIGGVSNAGIIGLLLFLIWLIAVSVSLIRRPAPPAGVLVTPVVKHSLV